MLCFICGVGLVGIISEAFESDFSDLETFKVIHIERVDFSQHFDVRASDGDFVNFVNFGMSS